MIYKIQDGTMNFAEGRVRCDADSDAVGASGFLSMPGPRSDAENQIYFDIVPDNFSLRRFWIRGGK